jgi:hypothetical protein
LKYDSNIGKKISYWKICENDYEIILKYDSNIGKKISYWKICENDYEIILKYDSFILFWYSNHKVLNILKSMKKLYNYIYIIIWKLWEKMWILNLKIILKNKFRMIG